MAFNLTEDELMEKLTSVLQKAESEGKSVSVGIYGGTEDMQKQLSLAVFDERYQNNCIYIQGSDGLYSADYDVLWTFEDVASPKAPCFFVNELSRDGVLTIISWTFENIPSAKQKSFVKHQKLDIDLKERYANKIIKQHCAGAFGVGFVPIPFADAPILVTNEISLMGRIFDVYGLADVKQVVETIGISALIGNLLTSLGKGLVGRLLKFIPVVGSVVGGFINAASATSVTLAFGKSVSKVVKKLCKAAIEKNLAEFDFIAKNFSSAVAGTALACVESGMSTVEDYEKSFDSTELSISDFEKNIQKGNELFQKFLDKNAELDDEFNTQQEEGGKKSNDMWDAISRL